MKEEPDAIANRARGVLTTAADKHLSKEKEDSIGYLIDQALEKIEERANLKGKSDLISKQNYMQPNKEIRFLCRADKATYRINKCNNIRKHYS